jgi:hypothetical protein
MWFFPKFFGISVILAALLYARPLGPEPPPYTPPSFAALPSVTGSNPVATGTIQVNGYYRRDGTYVAPHTRNAPGRGP